MNEYGQYSIETHHKFPLEFRTKIRELLKHVINNINDDVLLLLITEMWEQIRNSISHIYTLIIK